MRAHGQSDGDRICCGYKEYHDVAAIVKYIKAKPRYNNVPIVIMELSMGAGTAINSIGEIPEIDGLISLSAFSSWEDMFVSFMATHGQKFIANTIRPFVMFSAWVKYGENVWRVRSKNEIARLGNRPALLMHMMGDEDVTFDNFRRIKVNSPVQVETFVRRVNEHFVTSSFTKPEKDKEYSAVLMNFLNSHFAKR